MTKDTPKPTEISETDLDDVQGGIHFNKIEWVTKGTTSKDKGGEAITLPDAQERKVIGASSGDSGI